MQRRELSCSGTPPAERRGTAASAARVTGPQPVVTSLNVLLVCVALGGTLFQLFGMPWALQAFGIQAAWFLLPIMLVQPIHWGLLHEGVHARLFPGRRANEIFARVLSVTLGLAFDATPFSHLVHHRFPRHRYDRADQYDGRGPWAVVVARNQNAARPINPARST